MALGTLASSLLWAVDQLKAAGLNVAADPADVSLPGVIVYPNLVDYERLDADDYTLTLDLVMVASGGGRALDALDQLGGLLTQVRAILPVGECRAITVALPSQSVDPLPALQATITLSVSPEESE